MGIHIQLSKKLHLDIIRVITVLWIAGQEESVNLLAWVPQDTHFSAAAPILTLRPLIKAYLNCICRWHSGDSSR